MAFKNRVAAQFYWNCQVWGFKGEILKFVKRTSFIPFTSVDFRAMVLLSSPLWRFVVLFNQTMGKNDDILAEFTLDVIIETCALNLMGCSELNKSSVIENLYMVFKFCMKP